MPTRKELLEELSNEIGQLSSAVTDGSQDVRASAGALEEHGRAQIQAAETIADGLKEASGEILVASVVGGVLGLLGNALGNRIREINMRTDLIKSIQSLQARHASLSYEFILERSFAQGASKHQRQNDLNELIHDGIVTSMQSENGEVFSIDPNNPKLIERQEWLDSIKSPRKN